MDLEVVIRKIFAPEFEREVSKMTELTKPTHFGLWVTVIRYT